MTPPPNTMSEAPVVSSTRRAAKEQVVDVAVGKSQSAQQQQQSQRNLQIWMDGHLVDKADAKVSVYDHGLLYGDGVFEGIRVYNGKIFECDTHLKRLWDSAKVIRLVIPMAYEEMKGALD